jgi:TetR/AcrR family transcriptional regulator, cholesterol catabolism regulator
VDIIKPENKKLTPKKIQAMQTRQKIFDTAIKLYMKKGYEKVTVDEICKNSGFSKGAFYNYFNSKDQVIYEHFIKIDKYYEEAFKRFPQDASSQDKLDLFVREITTYICENYGKAIMKVIYQSQLGPSKKTSPISNQKRALYRIINAIVLEGQGEGKIRSDLDSLIVTERIVNCIRGLLYDWCIHDNNYDLQEAGSQIAKIIFEGLKN